MSPRDQQLIRQSWERAAREAAAVAPTMADRACTDGTVARVLRAIDGYWLREATAWIAYGMEGWKASQQHAYLRSDFIDLLPWAEQLHRLANQHYYDHERQRVRDALESLSDRLTAYQQAGLDQQTAQSLSANLARDLERLEADAARFGASLAEDVTAALEREAQRGRSRDRLFPDWAAVYRAVVAELRQDQTKLTWASVTTRVRAKYPQAESLAESTVRTWCKEDGLPHPAKL